MTETTANLSLPYIMPSQAQKHVTHNEAIRMLDALVQLAVLDRDLIAPPASPIDGDRHIVAGGPSGGWSGHDGHIAAFQDGAWEFFAPRLGWSVWVADEEALLVWDGATWKPAPASVNPTPLIGVNATADAANRLSLASAGSLFSHQGSGHRLAINKSAAADTASVLFQTGFAGRAEFGTAGDDDFHVKVSADGTTWTEALVIDRATGMVALPHSTPPGTVAVEDEGVETLAFARRVNFAGAGVSVAYAGLGKVTVTVPGTGGTGNVPSGGGSGQILVKQSSTSFDTVWTGQAGIPEFPAYANAGGQGDRTASIVVTASPSLLAEGNAPNLVDGSLVDSSSFSVAFTNSLAVAGLSLTFDFGIGAARLITEATWRQSQSQTHGSWQWQGSRDGATWSAIGAAFVLGGAAVQLHGELAGNAIGYRYYRLLGISGAASGVPYVREIQFRIGRTLLDGVFQLPAAGAGGQLLAKLSDSGGNAGWIDPPGSFPMHTDGMLAEWHFREGVGTTVRDIRQNRDIIFDAGFRSAWSAPLPDWTRRGLRLENSLIQTPSIPGVRTAALVFRVKRGDAGNFVLSGGPGGSGGGVLGDSASPTFACHVGCGAGIAPLVLRASTGEAAHRLNRGGWMLVFCEYSSASSTVLGFGGRHSATTYRCAEFEIGWAGCWNDTLAADERKAVYDGCRAIMAQRGVFLDWRDCAASVDAALLWGQSNAEGNALIADLSAADLARKPCRNVLIAPGIGSGSRYASPESLAPGENQQWSNPGTRFGPEFGAAWAHEDADASRVRPLAISKFSPGSTWLAGSAAGVAASQSWNAAELPTSGLLWAALTHWWDMEQRLLSQGIGPRLRALWWMQGEQDATGTAWSAGYQANLQALWDAVKLHTGYAAGAKAVIARIRDLDPAFNATAKIEVRAAQAAFVSANAGAASLIDTDGFALAADQVHYSAAGMKALGQAFYGAMDTQ